MLRHCIVAVALVIVVLSARETFAQSHSEGDHIVAGTVYCNGSISNSGHEMRVVASIYWTPEGSGTYLMGSDDSGDVADSASASTYHGFAEELGTVECEVDEYEDDSLFFIFTQNIDWPPN